MTISDQAGETETVRLSAAFGRHVHVAALEHGQITIPGYRLAFTEVTPIIAAFRRMVRELEFDVCELAPTTYIAARAAGIPITAIPVFLHREFHHGDIVCRRGSGIEAPRDLEGRRVGVRAYTVSTGVWARALLESEYGVDLGSITWVVDDEEHVQSFPLPDNVVTAPAGTSIAALFHAGELDAALTGPAGIGRSGPPGAGWETAPRTESDHYPLLDNAPELERAYFAATGICPLHALVALKQAVAAAHPELGRLLLDAFETAKRPLLEALEQGSDEPSVTRYRHLREIVGADPLPYGLADNLTSINALLDACVSQRILTTRPAVEDMFLT